MDSLYTLLQEEIKMLPIHPTSSSYSSTPTLTDSCSLYSPQVDWLNVPDFTASPLGIPVSLPVSSGLYLPQNPLFLPNISMNMPLGNLDAAIIQPEIFMDITAGCGIPEIHADTLQIPPTSIKTEPSISGDHLRRRNAVFVPRMYSDAVVMSSQVETAKMVAELPTDIERMQIAPASAQSTPSNRNATKCKYTKKAFIKSKSDKSKHRIYRAEVKQILEAWIEEHKDDPYPTTQEKNELMGRTGLDKMQFKNYFCNVRRRKLPHTIRRPKAHTARANRQPQKYKRNTHCTMSRYPVL